MNSVLVMLVAAVTIFRLYRRRNDLKQLTKQEWRQYIGAFLLAWGLAVLIIIGGAKLLHVLDVETFRFGFAVMFIVAGLAVARVILSKLLPQKVRDMYKY